MDSRLFQPGTEPYVILFAEQLYWKFGFHDGDILDDALYALLAPARTDKHAVLVALVQDKLLPVLPMPVEVEVINTTHNPIRVVEKHQEDGSAAANNSTSVRVTYGEIQQYMERINHEKGLHR